MSRAGARLRGRFSKPPQQAAAVMKNLQGSILRSVGTVRNYEAALTRVAQHMREERLGALVDLDPVAALDYLRRRATAVGQKQLDMERQAIQSMLRHVTARLGEGETLAVINPPPENHQENLASHRSADDSARSRASIRASRLL